MKTLLRTWYGKTQRLRQTELQEKHLFYLLLSVLILVLIPLFSIARYDIPAADDYGAFLHHTAWLETHSILAVLKAAVQCMLNAYYNWQGNFSVIILVQPFIFDERLYSLTAVIILPVLCFCVSRLCLFLFRDLFGGSKYQAGIIAVLALVACTQMLPSPAEGFYWFPGTFMYAFYFSLSLLLYTGMLRYLLVSPQDTPPFRLFLRITGLSLLSFVIGGSNYVSALLTALFYCCVLLVMFCCKDKRRLVLLIPCALFFVGFALNILAPGNAVRQSVVTTSGDLPAPSAAYAISQSFYHAISFIYDWTGPVFICMLVLLVPVLYRIAGKTTFSFRFPLLVLGASFCFLAAEFCPHLYAGRNPGPGRYINIVYFSFVLFAVFDLFYLLGWLRRFFSKWSADGVSLSESVREKMRYSPVFLGAFVVVFLFCCLFTPHPDFASVSAARSLASGEAAAYYDTYQQRLEILYSDRPCAVLPSFEERPDVLFVTDIDLQADNWKNVSVAQYYGKDLVVLR